MADDEFLSFYHGPRYTNLILDMMKVMIDMYGDLERPYPPCQRFA